MRLSVNRLPEGKLVGVRVGIVEEAAFLGQQSAGVHAGSVAAVPAVGTLTDSLFQRGHRPANVIAFVLFGEIEVLDPPPAVAADIKARVPYRLSRETIPFNCQCTSE